MVWPSHRGLSDGQIEVLRKLREAGKDGLTLGELDGDPSHHATVYSTLRKLEDSYLLYIVYRLNEADEWGNQEQVAVLADRGRAFLALFDAGTVRREAARAAALEVDEAQSMEAREAAAAQMVAGEGQAHDGS
jgi:hypothetical protein